MVSVSVFVNVVDNVRISSVEMLKVFWIEMGLVCLIIFMLYVLMSVFC